MIVSCTTGQGPYDYRIALLPHKGGESYATRMWAKGLVKPFCFGNTDESSNDISSTIIQKQLYCV